MLDITKLSNNASTIKFSLFGLCIAAFAFPKTSRHGTPKRPAMPSSVPTTKYQSFLPINTPRWSALMLAPMRSMKAPGLVDIMLPEESMNIVRPGTPPLALPRISPSCLPAAVSSTQKNTACTEHAHGRMQSPSARYALARKSAFATSSMLFCFVSVASSRNFAMRRPSSARCGSRSAHHCSRTTEGSEEA
jgi:hypothetical protein